VIFVLPVIAKPEHLALGSYKVNFDAEKELQDWNITKKETETLMGSPEVVYGASSADVFIRIECYDFKGREGLRSIDDYRKSREEDCKAQGMTCDSYPRKIDGRDGYVAPTFYQGGTIYEAGWHLDNSTFVSVTSFYPWDEGTLQLLKTINVTTTG